ncbi:hypothetical protein GA0115255_112841 [Streptomyces sp. Ncost-T6T-2b]|nr:hypothetical protein GA0115255_112841 [Streptomyces sp. Ncost-T6T-2b]
MQFLYVSSASRPGETAYVTQTAGTSAVPLLRKVSGVEKELPG